MSAKRIPVKNFPNLFRNPDTGVYYFRIFKKGFGRIEKSTGTDVLNKAKGIAEEIRATFLRESPDERKQKRVVADEWVGFLALQKNKAPNTYESKEIQGRVHILPFFGQYFPNEVDEVLWEKYISHYREADDDDDEINNERKFFNDRKYLSEFLHYLHRLQKIKRVPKLRDPDPEIDAGRAYSPTEIKKFLEAALKIRPGRAKRTLMNPGDLYLQILCALTMGMRVYEILSLEWDQINLESGTIFLPAHKVKTRKARTFSISVETLNLFKERAKALGPVFPSPTDPTKHVGRTGNKSAWRRCRELAGVSGRFHWFRHTFLTLAFKKPDANAAFICKYAGLTLEEAERTYLHFDIEDIRVVGSLVTLEGLAITVNRAPPQLGKV